MEFKDLKSVNIFMEMVDRCKGNVKLISDHGDCWNLNSKTSQFSAIVRLITDENIQKYRIVSSDVNDRKNIMQLCAW